MLLFYQDSSFFVIFIILYLSSDFQKLYNCFHSMGTLCISFNFQVEYCFIFSFHGNSSDLNFLLLYYIHPLTLKIHYCIAIYVVIFAYPLLVRLPFSCSPSNHLFLCRIFLATKLPVWYRMLGAQMGREGRAHG